MKIASIILLCFTISAACAQTPHGQPSFEVASIKRADPNESGEGLGWKQGARLVATLSQRAPSDRPGVRRLRFSSVWRAPPDRRRSSPEVRASAEQWTRDLERGR